MWMAYGSYEKIASDELEELFNTAYVNAANIEKAASGFRNTGISASNPDAFAEDGFYADNLEMVNFENPLPENELIGILPPFAEVTTNLQHLLSVTCNAE
jgi:hypothetical protein